MSNRIDDLAARIALLRLPYKVIADRSRLDETTVGRAFGDRHSPLNSTLDKIETVVEAEETRVLDALTRKDTAA